MEKNKGKNDLLEKIMLAAEKARKKLIEKEKKENGYLIIADKNGNPIKVPAKDL